MAQDVVDLLDFIGWNSARSLHVIGVSMGGMIAQELVSPALRFGLIHTLNFRLTDVGGEMG